MDFRGDSMPVELVKDILKIDEIKGVESTQTLVETEIYLNQSKPEIEKILWIDGKVEIMNVKIVKDMLVVNGILKIGRASCRERV